MTQNGRIFVLIPAYRDPGNCFPPSPCPDSRQLRMSAYNRWSAWKGEWSNANSYWCLFSIHSSEGCWLFHLLAEGTLPWPGLEPFITTMNVLKIIQSLHLIFLVDRGSFYRCGWGTRALLGPSLGAPTLSWRRIYSFDRFTHEIH